MQHEQEASFIVSVHSVLLYSLNRLDQGNLSLVFKIQDHLADSNGIQLIQSVGLCSHLSRLDERSLHHSQFNGFLQSNLQVSQVYLILECSLQEAQKRMKIKKPPHILVIHLKRFKYMEQLGRHKKLSYRVVFPLELKLANSMEDVDSEYTLFAVVVHVGSGPNHGHYVSLVKSHNHWLFFDDENVEMIDESAVQTFFGSAQEYSSNTDHGYILFYESLAANGKG